MAALVGVSLLVVSTVLIYLSVQAHLQEVLLVQQSRSRAAASEIGSYIYELQRKLGYLSRVQGFTDLSEENQLAFLKGLTRQNDAYESIAILDGEGQHRLTLEPYGFEPLVHAEDTTVAFSRAFHHGEDFIGPVRIDDTVAVSIAQATGAPVVSLAVPLYNRQDEIDGALVAYVNLHFLWALLDRMQVGKTGYAYVIDTQNVVIAQQQQSVYSLQPLLNQALIQRLRQRTSNATLSDLSLRSKIYRGLRHQYVFGATTQVPGVNWLTAIEMPLSEAISPSLQLMAVMGIALLLSVEIAIAIGIILSQQTIRPLRQLTQAAIQLSKGNLQVPISQNPKSPATLVS